MSFAWSTRNSAEYRYLGAITSFRYISLLKNGIAILRDHFCHAWIIHQRSHAKFSIWISLGRWQCPYLISSSTLLNTPACFHFAILAIESRSHLRLSIISPMLPLYTIHKMIGSRFTPLIDLPARKVVPTITIAIAFTFLSLWFKLLEWCTCT